MNIQDTAISFLEYIVLIEGETGKHWTITESAPELFREMVMEIHGKYISDEWTMQFIYDSLSALAENDDENREPFVEPDGYSNQLTNWVDSRDDRLHYLTRALQEEHITDGFLALQKAQYIEKKAVLGMVQNYILTNVS